MVLPSPEPSRRERVRLAAAIAIAQQAVQIGRPAAELVAALKIQLAARRAQPADVRSACDAVASILERSRSAHVSLGKALDAPFDRLVDQLHRSPAHAPAVLRSATLELGKLVEQAAASPVPERALEDAIVHLLRFVGRMLALPLPSHESHDVERLASVAIALQLGPAIEAASDALLQQVRSSAALSSAA